MDSDLSFFDANFQLQYGVIAMPTLGLTEACGAFEQSKHMEPLTSILIAF
jgi:hypothetical protein